MKKIVILVSLIMMFNYPLQAQEDEDMWQLDTNASNSESYDNVLGSYKGFQFFSKDTIKKSKTYEELKTKNIETLQNKILLEDNKETNKYKDLDEFIWKEMVVVEMPSTIKTESKNGQYLIISVIVVSLATFIMKKYYKKQRKRIYDKYKYLRPIKKCRN